MTAGMGDAIMAPIYEVLRKRGVTFRFFHAVTVLSASVDAGAVDRIDIVRQVDIGDAEYCPLWDVAGLSAPAQRTVVGAAAGAGEGCGTRFETELDCSAARTQGR